VDDPLLGLDEDQRACVTAPPGPLAIEAGPGSGKTRVLAARVAYRVQVGTAEPRRVLVVTFTRQAATELRQRLRTFGVSGPKAATLHALAYELVERYGTDRRRPRRRVVPTSRRLLRKAIEGLPDLPLEALVGEAEWAAARGIGPSEVPEALSAASRTTAMEPDLLAEALARYERVKRSRGVLDLGDLLVEARVALEDPVFGAATRWRFPHLSVDEAQDLNPAQWSLVRALVGQGDDLCLIGDADQAIYGWNGADARFLTDFATYFPHAARYRLTHNYRCPPELARTAAALLGREAIDAAGDPLVSSVGLDNEGDEASFVVERVQRALHEGVGPGQVAVLARTNAALQATAASLREAGIAYQDGRSVLDHPAVKEALHRLEATAWTLPSRGCSSELRTIAGELHEEAAERGIAEIDLGRQDGVLRQLLELVEDWAESQPSARGSELGDWLAGAVRGRGGDPGPAHPAVSLATFHRAKGLQWRRVFIVGAEAGLVPLTVSGDGAEERRLFYVALTRAEEEVVCTWARHREGRDGWEERRPTPYLLELGISEDSERHAEPESQDAVRAGLERLRRDLLAARRTARHHPIPVPAGSR